MNKVLVVDDDPLVTGLVKINLELEDFEVAEAWGGEEALQIISDNAPDLVLLDVMMPELDGWDLLRILRENPSTRELPVILLTAKVQERDVAKGWQMGADGYITKPFNPLEMVERLKAVLAMTGDERLSQRRNATSKYGDSMDA